MRVHYRFRIVEDIRSVADHGRDPDRVGDIAVPDRTQIVEPFKMTAAGPVLQPPATNDSPTDPSNWFGAIHRGVDVVPAGPAHHPPASSGLGPHCVGVVVLVIHGITARRARSASVTRRWNVNRQRVRSRDETRRSPAM